MRLLDFKDLYNTKYTMAVDYEKAGVSLEAGYDVVRRIKKHVASTDRLGVMGNIGAFGGMFDLSKLNIKEPVLVSGTDGVGTKLKLAFAMDKHDTIGVDAVAMCVNDVLAQGAEPLVSLTMWPRERPVRRSWRRLSPELLTDVVRPDAPSWAARPPRCLECTRTVNMTSRASPQVS